jgi:NAD(P) transhydrogenase
MSSANAGCKFGMVGVFGALTASMVDMTGSNFLVAIVLMLFGGVCGGFLGMKVSPIALPQTVAAFHSLVGLAAMCTSIGSFWANPHPGVSMENVSAVLGDFIGGVTLTGSLVAFGKLNGNLGSKPLDLPGKNYLNLGGLLLFIALTWMFLQTSSASFGFSMLWMVAVLASVMGVHLVASVGGGDMPVCITVLNSYSGWALVAEGFLLKSTVLTIVGSLIGFSGAILTKIMCDAMNRDIFNVLFGGINNAPVVKGADTGPKEHQETSVAATAEMLCNAKEVLVVPGYGMAMARAQTAMGELANVLRKNNINMKFGVHPVAGRMPGQMNVLLAEAGVPHEWVLEMDEVNPDMENNDVVLVVGANDVVNSAAQEVEGCAIWGMPVIEVWRSKKVVFCKRSMGGGYADLDNPVFYKENTEMLLGDAKKTADSLAVKVRERLEQV